MTRADTKKRIRGEGEKYRKYIGRKGDTYRILGVIYSILSFNDYYYSPRNNIFPCLVRGKNDIASEYCSSCGGVKSCEWKK